LYATPNIIRVMKSKRMRWPGHVARMAEMRNVYKIVVGRNHSGVDWTIILERILGKWGVGGDCRLDASD